MADLSIELADSGTFKPGPWRDKLHEALDRIMDRMESDADDVGGIVNLVQQCSREADHVHTVRLMLIETTNSKDCVWCGGTGVEGS